ncbi:thiol reductant ABC exporter subunit CydD [Aureimonas sp. D3]|uniref:thiol reductant ABC exporter subunit CydD n=1 Tax=Aureimonas sp. D3 TaxID=1638164 RepID=UPI00078625D6|nr:thiol reductant ABC exporter subunit CydD [Aureimonas sp. D3]
MGADRVGGGRGRDGERRWLGGLRTSGGWPLALAVTLPLVSGVLVVAQAWVLAHLLGEAASGTLAPEAETKGALALAGLFLARAGLAYGMERAGSAGAERIKARLRLALFDDWMARRPDWGAGHASGALASALLEQVEALDGFFARFLPAMVAATVLPIGFAACVFPVDWVVGLLLLVTAPLIPLFMALVGWGAQAAGEAQASALSRLSGFFGDRLRGLSTLVLFGQAEGAEEAMARAGEEWRLRTLKVLRIAFLSSAVLEFFAALGVAGVALYVGLSFLGFVPVGSAPLTLEAGLFCLLMAPEIYAPLRQLAAHYHDRASAKAAVGEIAAQFGTLPALVSPKPAQEPDLATPLSEPAGVEVCALTLRTPDGARPVLDAADLLLSAGSHVAILGASGSGKSTLLEALAGLRAAQGTIRLAGRPLDEITEPALRQAVALLPQRPHLFAGTIAQNIRLADPLAGDAALIEAAERARVLDFALDLPDGLETRIGEGGFGLSGGERHRVALARLYLRQPSILLLDEPTAHLDRQTECEVLDDILRFAGESGRTLVIATHSLAVAQRMDLVLRIENRRLIPLSGRPRPILASREYAA